IVLRAYDNWAAAGALPALILGAAVLRNAKPVFLGASIVLGVTFQVAIAIADAVPERVMVPFLSGRQPYARFIGWRSLHAEAEKAAQQSATEVIATDSRAFAATLTYYSRHGGRTILAWGEKDAPPN